MSFQPGGAVFLAVVSDVATATTRLDATPHATLDGFRARGGRFPATVVLGLAAFAPWSDKRGRRLAERWRVRCSLAALMRGCFHVRRMACGLHLRPVPANGKVPLRQIVTSPPM
jgi:hypothetical protein